MSVARVFAGTAVVAAAVVGVLAGNGGARGSALAVSRIESILQDKGTVTNGVLDVSVERNDIGTVYIAGTPIKPSFEVNGDLTFQPLAGGQALFNGDIPLRPSEVNAVVNAVVENNLSFQAEHQHFYDFNPPVWFVHFRGTGNAVRLAHAVHNVLELTSTPSGQAPPANPTTPLNAERLKTILHGYDAEVGSDGVVTVFVARRNPISIQGIPVRPETNIATNVAFEPLNATGSLVAAAPDFAMQANEINGVVRVMHHQGWDIGCLYNQETAESPQLYFSHQFKTGNPYQLAHQIRNGLDQTNSR